MDQCKEGDDTWTVDLLPEATPKLIVWHKHFVSASNNLTRNFLIVSPKLDSSSMMAWSAAPQRPGHHRDLLVSLVHQQQQPTPPTTASALTLTQLNGPCHEQYQVFASTTADSDIVRVPAPLDFSPADSEPLKKKSIGQLAALTDVLSKEWALVCLSVFFSNGSSRDCRFDQDG
ncbi:hypothetical protein LIPSTDRAFT_5020 [Lipomyces starkeyi NRRL Y-11557]|uniref:Uncharacterized protein n=1 Tax=Lipomyces starkeyi NRRL Y-11557 TaxID=675824 RepID=A0A1E3Q452_LIPST|nr:hypothetical protein LIPSTDRAFT_5020 [Lipomyces starkeyi NRRL Y-11557]